ncbi:hypothetical protein NMG60_11004070 [Bertholletia excelsa]
MDSIVHAALEEVCSQGANGLALSTLWAKLNSPLSSQGLHLCPSVKNAIWTNLISIPGLQFEGHGVSYESDDPKIRSVEESEKLNLKIVAAEHLRNSFVGIYDIKASDARIPQIQRRALERLAIARTNGITQSELAKEFGMKGNNIFYILKHLESRGLIVRQSTILRTKESSKQGESKSSSIVNTNMLYLYRYAKHLGCQKRLEIIKEDKGLVANDNVEVNAVSGDVAIEEGAKEDVHIKDYLPALKAICDKLEQADGKILVVADIKRDLGYRGTAGHRAWRNICNRLKDARVVEEFIAQVNKKMVNCLRLLKSFSPKNFEPKTLGRRDDLDMDQLMKMGKRGQITDQVVELPIQHQIYDMVDAEGSKGLTITEICKRLGIKNKQYYTRLFNMFSRLGMHLEAENHNKGLVYRVWTSQNFKPEASNIIFSKPDNILNENGASTTPATNLDLDIWGSDIDVRDNVKSQEKMIEPEHLHSSAPNELQMVSTTASSNVAAVETTPALSTAPRQRSYQKYPCLTLTTTGARREQWIIQRLQEEKFIIRAELHRELESLEKEKKTIMDRRTLVRSLNKLQQEGLCKCIQVSVPVISNCGRSRTAEVVLQPSLLVSPELLGQIHERLRSFDMEIRSQGSSRLNKAQSVPVLDGVQRISKSEKLDIRAKKSEAMRANGFVLAKMVRAKLLHIHLWSHLISSPGWDDALSSGKHGYDLKNPHSTCVIFELEAAIKAMPLELFLQVVGSTQNFDDLIEKCRSSLHLSDLPEQEYKHLMDIRATGRLSWIVDILRRLKLIRLVRDGLSEDIANVPHATLTYALELKPYIEEPASTTVPSSGITSFDLRPQIRHDFVLSSRKAIDEYWNTLEYSYAAADSRAALYAFPGSAVHEVFLSRSWASVRVMTADQHAELLKRIVNDDPLKKLSFEECEEIAKDLNLTLEQVLRVYYDKCQQHLARFRGAFRANRQEFQHLKRSDASSSRKRKKYSGGGLSRHKKLGSLDGHPNGEGPVKLSHSDSLFTEDQNLVSASSVEPDESNLQTCQDDDLMDTIEETEPNEEAENHSFIYECALSRMRKRQKKFSWTEQAERQLVIEYVRYRAALGAKFHRTDWSSMPNLPASPDVCKRRMALLNSDMKFRKAVMKLCNMLGERYVQHLDKMHNKLLGHDDCSMMHRDSIFGKGCCPNVSDSVGHNGEFGLEEQWDNFDNKNIKIVLDEVLRYKQLAKLDASKSKRAGSASQEWSDLNMEADRHDQSEKLVSPLTTAEDVHLHGGGSDVDTRRSRCNRVPQKYIKLLNGGYNVCRQVYESLAVPNAAELFKLVFLSTSKAPEVANLLAETLRHYSEHDLFAAFSYLREKKIMVGGKGGNPFVLSQHFLHSLSSSPFPSNTGKRATKFASLLREREKDMMEEGIYLTADLQCGDIFHLCALVFSGEVLISPCLPDEGVGETEDSRTSKRKSDTDELGSSDKAKKLKSTFSGEGEVISRREKGFPGIRLLVSSASISATDAMALIKDDNSHCIHNFGECNLPNAPSINIGCDAFPSDHVKETLDKGRSVPTAASVSESEWETMTSYAKHLISLPTNQQEVNLFNSELFRNVYLAIQKAGDQGLTMEEVTEFMKMPGENMPELVIEVLETFGKSVKVNSFNSVHVVDSLYRSKYFLTSIAILSQHHLAALPSNSKIDDKHLNHPLEDHDANASMDLDTHTDVVHKVTILNLPEEVQTASGMQNTNQVEGCKQVKFISMGSGLEGERFEFPSGDFKFCRPILPWVNGDGTVNQIVYRGLVRRVLGIVMQNPGILEDDIINRMSVLNPQSCRDLLKLMIMDNHIIVRKMHEASSVEPPLLLGSLLRSSFGKSKLICREHYFANPMSTSLL